KWFIDKRDDRGRSLDVHALQHTFGTLLSRGGVAPRTAQAAMRHGDIRMTMNNYTDPALLDVLPALPLERDQAVRATGTDGDLRHGVCLVVPAVATTPDNRGTTPSLSGNPSSGDVPHTLAASGSAVKGKGRLSSADNRPFMSGRLDSNQRPPEPHSGWRSEK